MQSWKNNHASIHAAPQQFGVLLFDNFSNHCLANMIEPLRAANDLLGFEAYRWTFLTLDGGPATSSSGLPVMAHQKLSDASGDGLILLPSYGYRQLANGAMDRALRAASRRFQTLIGLDTGAWLLAHAGLLDGHPATIHFEEFDAFSERFPDVNARRERWVIAPGRITASGAMTAFDLAQHMIGERHGQAVTLDIAALFMHGDLPRPQTPSTRDKYVTRALAEMQAALEHPVTIAELARRCGASQKELERRSKEVLGATPQQVYRRLRLVQGRKLVVESPLSITEIALRCGYEDSSAFTRAFRQEFGLTPREMRR